MPDNVPGHGHPPASHREILGRVEPFSRRGPGFELARLHRLAAVPGSAPG
ncbi:MAG: hypothetical protein JNL87_16040 [Burkholderiaceae bacterium]|nr:hypothetical protein [Burkholderiaceae bacterium]